MYIKLTKIEELPNAEHPNNIPIGEEKIGIMHEKPEVGKCFYVTKKLSSWFRTSVVTEIIDDNTFRTLNSIYKITELKELPE